MRGPRAALAALAVALVLAPVGAPSTRASASGSLASAQLPPPSFRPAPQPSLPRPAGASTATIRRFTTRSTRTGASAAPAGATASSTPTDATSTATPDWRCIRLRESTNGRLSSNIYQFEGSTWRSVTRLPLPPGDYPRAVQNAVALELYAYALRVWGDGFRPWSSRFVCGL